LNDLKPIFKSEDIQSQFPEDAKRFEQIEQSQNAEMNKAVLMTALQMVES
jgi:hypothetical protein